MADTDEDGARRALDRLLKETRLGVLATEGADGPYTSLVGVAPLDGCDRIAFATERGTTKYTNLKRNPRASIMLDTRAAQGEDLDTVTAITVVGRAGEISDELRSRARGLLEKRLPQLTAFLAEGECAVMTLDVEWCRVVSGFQSGQDTETDMEA